MKKLILTRLPILFFGLNYFAQTTAGLNCFIEKEC